MSENQPRDHLIRLLEILDLAHQVHRLMTRRTQHLIGLTLEQAILLGCIEQQQGESSIFQLAASLSRTSHTISKVVDVLERKGLVRRRRTQMGDRRVVYVSMTLEGESTLRSFHDAVAAIIEPMLGGITEHELEFRLDRVIENLTVISGR